MKRLLILKKDEKTCECLVGNAKVVKLGTVVSFGNGELKAKCIEVKETMERYGFTTIHTEIENDWVAYVFKK